RMVGLDPANGDAYVFVGNSRTIMKILHWERGGYVMYYKRLEQGRFHPRIFLRQGVGFRSMRWDELVLLMEGISPRVARRRRYQHSVEDGKKNEVKGKNNCRNIWLYR
ncbi:MAG: IS66 family insertion sequence element accessory protein TnpB, partial [Muribaculaceae bacterium]